MSGIFNVYFDSQYWVGQILEENECEGQICRKAGRFIFGAEPTPHEIFEWVRKGCPGLRMLDVPAGQDFGLAKESRRAKENKGRGSYSQEQMRLAVEKNKKERKEVSKARKLEEKAHLFELRQLKKKKKKRGH